MFVERLSLEDWRNYHSATLEFAPGINAVVGRNAQGKTNMLEAIAFLTGLGSPRSTDSVLVREGAERALVHATLNKSGRQIAVDIELRGGRSRVLLNKVPVEGPKSLTELFVAVFFGPDELALVKAGPDARRRYLDELAIKTRPSRHAIRKEFERTLKQRNALLRSAPRQGSVGDTLDVWDESFARSGAALVAARLSVLQSAMPLATKRYESVAGGGRLELSYESGWLSEGALEEADIADNLRAHLAELRPRELERGVSLAGPQRDDLGILLQSESGLLPARSHASQGDQRTAALALKLAESDLVADVVGQDPVLLLDDVFSELDPHRREWLVDAVRSGGQTFISSADTSGIDAIAPDRVIEVVDGRTTVIA